MIRHWKSATVGTPLLLAALALGGYAYTRAHAAPTYHLANGVDVAVAEVPPDDTARVLDIHVWKLDVLMPNDRQMCSVTIDQCGRQQAPKGLGGGGFAPFQRGDRLLHMTLDLAPLGGDMGRAQQIKYRLDCGRVL